MAEFNFDPYFNTLFREESEDPVSPESDDEDE